MAKETFVRRCFNWDVNNMVTMFECFGWELVSNNVVTSLSTSEAMNVATENELTFKRDKEAPWYSEVSKLQEEFDSIADQIEEIESTDPTKEMTFHWIAFILLFFLYGIGIIYGIVYLVLKAKNKNDTKLWHMENDPKIKEMQDRKIQIAKQSKALIDGKEQVK